MKHIFIPNQKGKHVKDGVRGTLQSFADSAVVHSKHDVLSSTEGITLYAETKLRAITQRELVDGLIEIGAAASFEALINSIPIEERLRFRASPTISPEYPFIKDNRAMLLAALQITSEQFDSLFK